MRLLVSVRSASEAIRALQGGADIIDAKEPARGSLGAVDGAVLREIADALSGGLPLSVALGDAVTPSDVERAVASLELARVQTAFLKVGFAGLDDDSKVRDTIGRLAQVAAELPSRPRVIAVAYADHRQAGSPEPFTVARLAAAAGADGILLDTWTKDGTDVFAWMPPSILKEWTAAGRPLGLGVAVAGSITQDTMATVLQVEPDIVGVRGAACDGGRSGSVSVVRVRGLKALLELRRNATFRPAGAVPSHSTSP
jgi:(5-formylfuran-3-yl)methyl phosphate synthase